MASARRDSLSTLPAKILQRKWLLIVPFVLVMSLIYGYTKNVDLYRSSSIVIFSTEYMLADRDKAIQSLFEDKISSVVGSLRFGEPLRSITSKVWPEINPNDNPIEFNNKAQRLGSKGGIELSFRRDNYRALTISYTSKDADEAYRVVKATIDTLVDEARNRTERRVTSSAAFLTSEIGEYEKKLKRLDQDIIRIESGLITSEDGSSKEIIGFSDSTNSATLPKASRYQRTLPQLEFDLKVESKELERLRQRLEGKEYLEGTNSADLLDEIEDPVLSEIRNSIAQKMKEQNILASQGLLKKHPKRRAITAELTNLTELEQDRLKELTSSVGNRSLELATLKLESALRSKVGTKASEITRIKDQISVMKQYETELSEQQDSLVSHLDVISAQRTKLEQLKHEKVVTAEAYHQAVSERELIGRQGRADADEIGLRITMAEPPTVPKYPLPLAHVSTIVMGLAISLAIGIGLLCLFEALDSSVRNAAELRAFVPVPVIGEVDRMISAEQYTKRHIQTAAIVAFLLLFVLFSEQIVLRLI